MVSSSICAHISGVIMTTRNDNDDDGRRTVDERPQADVRNANGQWTRRTTINDDNDIDHVCVCECFFINNRNANVFVSFISHFSYLRSFVLILVTFGLFSLPKFFF